MDSKTRALLTKILNEPSFRAELQANPVTALQSVQIAVSLAEVPKPVNLPSDDEIRALLVLDKPLERLQACLVPMIVCGWPKP